MRGWYLVHFPRFFTFSALFFPLCRLRFPSGTAFHLPEEAPLMCLTGQLCRENRGFRQVSPSFLLLPFPSALTVSTLNLFHSISEEEQTLLSKTITPPVGSLLSVILTFPVSSIPSSLPSFLFFFSSFLFSLQLYSTLSF